jgi:cytoskeletal protein CcmA (bactofilin family)
MFERGRKEPDGVADSSADSGSWSNRASSAPRSSGGGEAAVIGRSIKISGDLRGDEDLRIEGDVTGTVELRNSSLTIGKEGRIKADVYAKIVIVEGHMEGDVYASERIVIRASAQVLGNITAPRVGLDEGSRFKGAVEMDQEIVSRAFGQTKPVAQPGTASRPKPPEQRPAEQKPGQSQKEAAAN